MLRGKTNFRIYQLHQHPIDGWLASNWTSEKDKTPLVYHFSSNGEINVFTEGSMIAYYSPEYHIQVIQETHFKGYIDKNAELVIDYNNAYKFQTNYTYAHTIVTLKTDEPIARNFNVKENQVGIAFLNIKTKEHRWLCFNWKNPKTISLVVSDNKENFILFSRRKFLIFDNPFH